MDHRPRAPVRRRDREQHADREPQIRPPRDPRDRLRLARMQAEDERAGERCRQIACPAPQSQQREQRRARVQQQIRRVEHERGAVTQLPIEGIAREHQGSEVAQAIAELSVGEIDVPEVARDPLAPACEGVDGSVVGDERPIIEDEATRERARETNRAE